MTDEQFEKLIEKLKPEKKGRWEALTDSALGLLLGALALGFFGLLWQSRNDMDARAAKLETRAVSIEQSILGLSDTLKKEIGDLSGPLAVQANLKEAVVNQDKVLQGILGRLVVLEQRPTNNIAATKPETPPIPAPTPKLEPYQAVKSDEVLKAVRAKEDSIDQRLRSYQQRGVSKD